MSNGMIMSKKELKTNYKDVVKRYELAERMVWAKLIGWKKDVIVNCRKKDWEAVKNDRILKEYNKDVIELAESESVLDEKLPPVPKTKQNPSLKVESEVIANPS